MRKKLNEWADASKVLHGLVLIGFAVAILFSALSCADEFYFGKDRNEINAELSQIMFEVDSLLIDIQYMLDSTHTDGTYHDIN